MTDPRDIWVAGFCTGAAFIGALAGWFGPTERTNNGLWNKQHRRDRGRDHDWRRSFNHENTNAPQDPPPLKFRRRPKPPSLKEQALEALARQERGRDRGSLRPEAMADADTIRRALESPPD